ncbi:hypothetical protein AB0N05_20740 [Nocardia sp. NPDC051030]|uniref:hypothetical protein n=1 Tax=Nocardia sp. NPDC051030 TaxID=3155162 RepID=UPI0034162130
MKHRYIFGGTLAATVVAAALGLSAPAASAQELASGVSCHELSCTNDTDDTYRVESKVTCSAVKVFPMDETVSVTTYVAPHASARLSVSCPSGREMGKWEDQPDRIKSDGTREHQPSVWKEGDLVPRFVARIEHLSAVVDNDPKLVRTGSAG